MLDVCSVGETCPSSATCLEEKNFKFVEELSLFERHSLSEEVRASLSDDWYTKEVNVWGYGS